MPTLNQGKFLDRALQSVFSQHYADLELIVVDGGSTDESVRILERYRDRISSLISEPDEGQVDALEKGFRLATGDVLGWLNSDDRLLPDALSAVAETYANIGGPCVLVGAGGMVDMKGRLLFERWPSDLTPASILNWQQWFMQAAVFFPAAAYRELGGLARDLDYAFDFDLWVRLSQRLPFVAIPQLLAEHTRHADAKTEQFRGRSFAETRLVQIRHGATDEALKAIDELFQHDQALHRLEECRLLNRLRRGLVAMVRQMRLLTTNRNDGSGGG